MKNREICSFKEQIVKLEESIKDSSSERVILERDFKIIKDILDREQKINKTLETTLEIMKKSNHDPQHVSSENRVIIEA